MISYYCVPRAMVARRPNFAWRGSGDVYTPPRDIYNRSYNRTQWCTEYYTSSLPTRRRAGSGCTQMLVQAQNFHGDRSAHALVPSRLDG